MKRLGIISDTHLSETGRRGIPERVFEYFAGVDFIIHAGDFTARRAIRDLESIAPVVGVRGNNDPAHLELPRSRRLQVEQVTIGLCHGDRGQGGHQRPFDQFPGNGITAAHALSMFEFEDDIDCLIFGHSHNPMAVWHRHNDRELLFFNPGSPTDKRWGPNYGCGLLTIDGDTIEPKLFLWVGFSSQELRGAVAILPSSRVLAAPPLAPMSAVCSMSELFIKQEMFKILPQIDAIIFDIDGVLLDVSGSFRAVITDTVQHFATQALNLTDTGRLLENNETELFKFAGGFNDDAELTSAAVALVIAKWAQSGATDTLAVRNQEPDWAEFTNQVRRLGGGLSNAEAFILELLSPTERRDFARQWNTRIITRVFQEMYAGDDACRELYGFDSEYIHGEGYYKREKSLVDPKLIPGKVKVGLLTGRTVRETRIALRLAGLTNRIPEATWVTADDGVKKPDGRALFHAREKMEFKNALYIGDTMDDLRTVSNYRETKGAGRARIASAITLSGPTGGLHRRAFLEADADIVAPDINFLLQYLGGVLK